MFETCASFERGSNKSNDHFIFMYNRFAMVILALIIHYKKVLTKKEGRGRGTILNLLLSILLPPCLIQQSCSSPSKTTCGSSHL